MLHNFEFNNKKLSDLGAVIIENPSYTLSVRELDFTSIPSKSGDVITDKNRFKNVGLSYKISSVPTFCDYTEQQFVYALSEWLLTSYDYKVLRDTYNPGYFRKAVCTDISNPTVEASGIVQTTVTFCCDPFLYSDVGAAPIVFESLGTTSNSLTNPEPYESEPIIKIIGDGDFVLQIGDFVIPINGVSEEITIDKPNENVYDKSGNACNNKISALKLPVLTTGTNYIGIIHTGAFTLEITPNWRRI